jgi:hypothetical protein
MTKDAVQLLCARLASARASRSSCINMIGLGRYAPKRMLVDGFDHKSIRFKQ